MEENNKTILPTDRNPIELNETMQDQKVGLEWLRARQAQLLADWTNRLEFPILPSDASLKQLAYETADLENDFNYVKDLNTYMATRYQEVWDVLPTPIELTALLKIVSELPADDHEFFLTAPKDERVQKLKKLLSAMKHAMGNV